MRSDKTERGSHPDCEAEVERLRAALVADDEGSTAYQNGWHARDAEIERLRGLLREAVDGPVRSRVVPHEGNWIRRVREALGE